MTRFENIKNMNIEEMARFFSADSYPNLPHSACDICQYSQGWLYLKPSDDCTNEYKAELYKKWLGEESE